MHPDASKKFLFGKCRLVDFKAAALPPLLSFNVPNPAAYEMYIKAGLIKNQLQCTSECLSDL